MEADLRAGKRRVPGADLLGHHEAAIENWIIKTNQYAKRQRTWFKTQFFADLTINHIPNENDLELII